MRDIDDIICQLRDVLDQDGVSVASALGSKVCDQPDDEEDAARDFLYEVVTDLAMLAPYQMSPQAIAELVNVTPDRFTLQCRDGTPASRGLFLDGTCKKAVDIIGWPQPLLETLECKDAEEACYGWEKPISREDIDKLLIEALGKARKSEEEGSFTLNWKNGDRVEMGQKFRVLPVVAGPRPNDVLTVESVNICDGSPRAYVYCKSTGYPIDSCEPVRDDPSDTCYNLNGNSLYGFCCSKCRKSVDIEEPVYCPHCGRRVL